MDDMDNEGSGGRPRSLRQCAPLDFQLFSRLKRAQRRLISAGTSTVQSTDCNLAQFAYSVASTPGLYQSISERARGCRCVAMIMATRGVRAV